MDGEHVQHDALNTAALLRRGLFDEGPAGPSQVYSPIARGAFRGEGPCRAGRGPCRAGEEAALVLPLALPPIQTIPRPWVDGRRGVGGNRRRGAFRVRQLKKYMDCEPA